MPLFAVSPDADTYDFLAGAARGELRIVRDLTTGEFLEPRLQSFLDPERHEMVAASGAGRIVSWSVGHRRGEAGAERHLFGIVQLDEGPWLWTELRGPEPWAALTGRTAVVNFAKTGPGRDDATIPYFIFA